MKQQNLTLFGRPVIPMASMLVVLVIVASMPLYPFLTTWAGAIFGEPLLWKVAKDVLLGVTFLAIGIWVLGDRERRRQLFRDKLIWLVEGFVVISLVVTAFSQSILAESLLAGVAIHARYLAAFLIMYLAVRFGELNLSLDTTALRFLAVAGSALAVIGVLQVFLLPLDTLQQFGYDKDATIAPFVLIDENPEAPRAFATLRGPNDFGAYLIMTVIAAALLTLRDKRWALGVFVMVFAMVLSSSRSAMLGLFFAAIAVAAVRFRALSGRARRWVLYSFGTIIIAGMLLLFAATTVPAIRLAVFHSSPGDPALTEGSTDKHWQATAAGIDRVADDPLGCGFGCAGPASFYSDQPKIAENWYVQVAEEFGIVGLLIWLLIFGYVMALLSRRSSNPLALCLFASGVGLSIVGVWLHVWADDPISLTWWTLAGLVIGYSSTTPNKQVEYVDETSPKTTD